MDCISPWGCKESDMTENLYLSLFTFQLFTSNFPVIPFFLNFPVIFRTKILILFFFFFSIFLVHWVGRYVAHLYDTCMCFICGAHVLCMMCVTYV